MSFYVGNILNDTMENENFRKVLKTNANSQLVVMAIQPHDDIGMETHGEHDQFIRIEQGRGKAILNGEVFDIEDDFAVVIPAGTEHNITNESDEVMKLYTVYSPAEHPDGTIDVTKADADAREGH